LIVVLSATTLKVFFPPRNRSFEWRLKTTVAVEGTRRQWGDESRRDHIQAMSSNFGRIGPSVAELWVLA
jgi:hypothetical protein